MIDFLLDKLKTYDDPLFNFDEESHTYTYESERFISVTQFISRFHEDFDTQFWADKKAKDRGITVEEIVAEWKEINDRSNFIGTSTHNWIENYFNKIWQPLPTDIDVIHRINKFNVIYATHLYKLTPVKFEIKIFSKKWKIAGMIDSIFLYKNKIIIIDHKTNKKFTNDEDRCFGNLLPPFENFKKNHLNEYSIQISLYVLILREIGINVDVGYLLYIGPDNRPPVLHKCIDMTDILERYLNELRNDNVEVS
jgi:ATP-dependent exoDNAse (exonuclease V) beta subunit